MTVPDTVFEAQTCDIEGVKTAQEQVVSSRERIAAKQFATRIAQAWDTPDADEA